MRRAARDPDLCLAHLGGARVARALEAGVLRDARGVGRVVTRAVALLAVPTLLAAQLPQAEEAFRRGDYTAARAGYERALAADSLNQRALFLLGVLDTWDREVSRTLHSLNRLRRLEPKDQDIMVGQAQGL